MYITLISPHRDDAAFSCGYLLTRLLRAGASVTIVNLFSRSSYAPFSAADGELKAVSAVRLLEDRAFEVLLRAQVGSSMRGRLVWRDAALADAPDRLHVAAPEVLKSPLSPAQYALEVAALSEHMLDLPKTGLVLLPAAIGAHIDHCLARDACLKVFPSDRVLLYEDLPYACYLNEPERLAALHNAFGRVGVRPTVGTVRLQDARTLKQRYALCYPSQIQPSTADAMDLYGSQYDDGEVLCGAPAAHAALQLALEIPATSRTPNEVTPFANL